MYLQIEGGSTAQQKQVTTIIKAILALGFIETKNLFICVEFAANAESWGKVGCHINSEVSFFVIGLDSTQNPKELADSVAHEMIHVYQFMCGDLSYTNKDQDFIWKGKPQKNVPYSKQPSEVLAHGFSQFLLATAELNYCT